ncbi:MAG: PHB depolymerase family esterase, partial [Betaproteobacteria bacterium]
TVPSGTSSTRSVSGCWDWFGTGWTRTNRDQVPLKKLVDAVMARPELDIDPNQVYVTGLSSGAGETHVLGCVFPDYFAGVGVNAGPALGSASTDIFMDPKVTAAQVASNCKAGNGNAYNSYFTTQIWNTIYGSSDAMVKPTHNVRNGDGMCVLYGMTSGSTCTSGEAITISGGGSGNQYRDGNGKLRVSVVSVNGMSHAWPAGTGGSGGGTYVDYTHVNYPVWITNWFFTNNLRTGGGGTTPTTTTTTQIGATTTTTTTTTTTAGACFNSSNYTHVTAGRATQSLGYVYANGSNQNMGLYNTYNTTKLRQTGSNYYVIDSTCP